MLAISCCNGCRNINICFDFDIVCKRILINVIFKNKNAIDTNCSEWCWFQLVYNYKMARLPNCILWNMNEIINFISKTNLMLLGFYELLDVIFMPLSPKSFPHNVSPDVNSSGSAGKRTQPGVQCLNCPQFNMAVQVALEHTYARNARDIIQDVCIIGLLHTEFVWHTSQALHAIWCSLTRVHRD